MVRYLEILVKVLMAGTCCVAASGCGAFRLPAIDPTGEHIFLPDPSYTTVVSPYDSTGPFACLPEPAFTEPPPIPPCTGMPMGTGIAPRIAQDHLILTPAKIVAPINSDVVLLAGLCGKEGFYVTKQPIEWMISPDSVGNIITLADSSYPTIARLAHHAPKKEASNLAITRTATAAHVITRGTAQPNDDIWVGKGQTWIAVSSPTEGTSYITAVAKAADNWDMRRQTTMIHWVDMQWAFPPPTIVRAGQPTTISTAVTKSSSGAPSVNTIVRYDIVQGTAASFNGDGRTSIELSTDENGRAGVQVVQTAPGPGATQLRVQIHATNLRGAANDRTVIGEGYTTITWSAPGLTVAIAGPPTVARNGTATYRINVGNPGDITTRNVEVTVMIPSDLKFSNCQPECDYSTNGVVKWQLRDLGPKQAVQLEMNFLANKSGEVRLVARGLSPDAPEANSVVDTKIVESSLAVRFVDPPATAVVGQRVEFNFVVENTGGVPLQNVLVRDVFEAGLQPDYPNVDPSRPMEFPPFSLPAGESRQLGIAFIARQPGQLCHQLEVTADGGPAVSDRACIEASQPVLKLEVRKTGVDQARVGDEVPFTIIVANTGEGVLTNVKITDIPDASLRPVQGTDGFTLQNGAVVWSLGTIGPGQTARIDIRCKCESVAPAAQNTVEVTADGGVRETTTSTVNIAPAPQVTPPTNPPAVPNNPPPAITGEFKAQIISANFGLKQGEVGQFYLTLRNERNVDEEEVLLNVQLPAGLDLKELNWTSKLNQTSHVNPRNFDIGPIQLIRANETGLTPIKLGLLGTKPGDYLIRVEVRSRNLQQPVIATTRVTVAP